MKHIFLFIGLFVSIYSYLCKSSLKTKPDSLTNQGLPGIKIVFLLIIALDLLISEQDLSALPSFL